MDERYQALTAVLSDYFDGLYHSDTARLARVFHPDARYVCATGGTLLHLGMDEYFPIVDRRPSPAGRNEPRADQIVSIEFAGPVTAFARVNCAIGERYFTDLLSFVFVEGRWQIIAKVFHYDVQN
jgi:4-oxalocrotonate tautomerase